MASADVRYSDMGWHCQECGHRFRGEVAARRAAFGDSGCPKCGSSDVDFSGPVRREQSLAIMAEVGNGR